MFLHISLEHKCKGRFLIKFHTVHLMMKAFILLQMANVHHMIIRSTKNDYALEFY